MQRVLRLGALLVLAFPVQSHLLRALQLDGQLGTLLAAALCKHLQLRLQSLHALAQELLVLLKPHAGSVAGCAKMGAPFQVAPDFAQKPCVSVQVVSVGQLASLLESSGLMGHSHCSVNGCSLTRRGFKSPSTLSCGAVCKRLPDLDLDTVQLVTECYIGFWMLDSHHLGIILV